MRGSIKKAFFFVGDGTAKLRMVSEVMNHERMDGSERILVLVHPHDPIRPLVQIGERFIDLSQDSSLHIQHIL